MICLLIAGACTQICLLVVPSGTPTVSTVVVWGGAVAGMLLKLARPHAPLPSQSLGCVLVLSGLLRTAGTTSLVLLLIGGGSYTLGSVCTRPDRITICSSSVRNSRTVLAACEASALVIVTRPGWPRLIAPLRRVAERR